MFLLFTATVAAAAALFGWGATYYARQAFGKVTAQRSDALVAQFRNEYLQRGSDVVESVESIAETEGTMRMALDLTRPLSDPSLYASDATGLAASRHLDFLELASDDGTLISSAEWPGRSGYRNDWVTLEKNWNQQGAFLAPVELIDNVQLGLLAVRMLHVGGKNFYVIGGRQLDRNFLHTVAAPAGTRGLLYRNLEPSFVPAALEDGAGAAADVERFAPLIQSVQNQPRTLSQAALDWTPGADAGPRGAQFYKAGGPAGTTMDTGSGTETFLTVPLAGRHNELLGVLLIGSSENELLALAGQLRAGALLIAAVGVLLGMFVSFWVSARVTQPLARLTSGAEAVARGNWGARVAATSNDEFGGLARAFNDMTRHLTGDRERLLQGERVAAWREVARRLASEVKEPLFPMQITIETLCMAVQESPGRFGEDFGESIAALRAELENLREVAARFSDFAKRPAPVLQPVSVNDALRIAVKSFESQFSAIGRPPITPELYLDERISTIHADPQRLRKALENLLAVSLEAMPAGGLLTIRSTQRDGVVRFDIANNGADLGAESAARMFTPYDAGEHQASPGAGFGLAEVLAIVSDHGGKIRAESAPGAGTTFRMEFPAAALATPATSIVGATPAVRAEARISEITTPVVEVADVKEAVGVAAPAGTTVPVSVEAAEAVSSPEIGLRRESAFRSGVASIFGLGSKPVRAEEPEFPPDVLADVTPTVLPKVSPPGPVDPDEVAWEMVRESEPESSPIAESEPAEQPVRES
jgi:two-component system, NtrC family, nitrogen regulation sensor histidine kinase NtrY